MTTAVTETTNVVDLFRRLLPIRADNPPGDTRAVAEFLAEWLGSLGAEVHAEEPKDGHVNLWATTGVDGGPHLVLCGHMDTFPLGDPSAWTHDASAAVVDEHGLIYGRGASAARGGLASMLWTFGQLVKAGGPQTGRLTLLAVADTESGGAWGAGWMVENVPCVVGTACLLGEPEGPRAIRIGEKGKAQFALRATSGRRYPGAFGGGDDPIIRICRAVAALHGITGLRAEDVPHEIEQAIAVLDGYARSPEEAGLNWLLRQPSLSVGKIEGGTKVNLAPGDAQALVDVRPPFGMTAEDIYEHVRRTLDDAELSDVALEPLEPRIQPSFTSPSDPFVKLAVTAVRDVVGEEPVLSLGYASTDARYFRPRGIPSIVYGPTPYNIGGVDEAVRLDELETIAAVHGEIVRRYLSAR